MLSISRSAAISSAFFLAATLPAVQLSAATTVSVPGGSPVKVHFSSSLSSSSAQAGQHFQITASSPLVIHGWIAVKRGAAGGGHVVSASPAGKSGKQGQLSIAFDWIYAADGTKLALTGIPRDRAGKNKTGSANTANVASTIVLGPVGLFAHNFVKGKDITVDPTHVFDAHIGYTQSVGATTKYSSM
jgi:hypothetical protein